MIRLALAFALAFALPASAQEATRKIENVTGDVYRFQNNFHYALVVPTSEGTVVVDPINAEASTWLKENLGEITDQPITHLIYSHSHGDHASGGTALGAETVIAQANAPEAIDGVMPTLRFDDTHTLELGGKTFELTYLGPGHGEDLIAVVVRPENVAFITDVAAPRRLFFRDFGGANIDDWIKQIEVAQGLNFDVFAPAHGNVGVKSDLDDVMAYMQDLKAGVLEGLKAGKSVDTITAELTLDTYKGWMAFDDWRPLNIQGMARYLQASGQAN